MARYIDREALLKDIEESVVFSVRAGHISPEMRGANKITDRIKSAPTADVVEVVRCKDCRKTLPGEGITGDKFCLVHEVSVPKDYYCASGERKVQDDRR